MANEIIGINSQMDVLLSGKLTGAQATGLYSTPKNLCLRALIRSSVSAAGRGAADGLASFVLSLYLNRAWLRVIRHVFTLGQHA
jgi:hypothetical protein